MFLLFIKFRFLYKNGVPEKVKTHLPQHLPGLQQLLSPNYPHLHFKKWAETAFYIRDYKGETIKLLPFYMTDFLFTEL